MIELRPDRNLIDPNFMGYKLSVNLIPTYKTPLNNGVDHILPGDEQYSFLHVKVFSLHNHLYGDPWFDHNVYFIGEDCVVISSSSIDRRLLTVVWQVPMVHERKSGNYNMSMSFSSSEMAVVTDGWGILHIVSTGLRTKNEPWMLQLSDEPCGKGIPFKIIHSRLNTKEANHELHCLLLHIERNSPDRVKIRENDGYFTTFLEWVVYVEGNNGIWSLKSTHQLSGSKGLEYAAIEPDCQAIYVASETEFVFVKDSETPIEANENIEVKYELPKYKWHQTQEDVTLCFQVNESVKKEDIKVFCETNKLSVSCGNNLILDGCTSYSLSAEMPSVWSIENNKLEIVLNKRDTGIYWNRVLLNDDSGEQIIDSALAAEVHERLAHLCSDEEAPEHCGPTFNSEQLEECDEVGGVSVLTRISLHGHKITDKVNLGGLQWLFSCQLKCEEVPSVCLRHDVDGCVWQPLSKVQNEQWKFEHVGTFLAFGYVQAGKQRRKFSVCAPDLSYAAICESSKHVYLYHQPVEVCGNLRNRKTGQKVTNVASQHVINLESTEEILGVHATVQCLFVLTNKDLYFIYANSKTS